MSLEDAQARIEARLAERRAQAAAALEQAPELAELDALVRATFGGPGCGLKYLKVGDQAIGTDWPPGIVPARYNKPPRGKGRIAWLRGLEGGQPWALAACCSARRSTLRPSRPLRMMLE